MERYRASLAQKPRETRLFKTPSFSARCKVCFSLSQRKACSRTQV